MIAHPIRLTVVRYQCPHCTHRRAHAATVTRHIGRCWHNPEVRACQTCAHHLPAEEPEPGHRGSAEQCDAGVPLPTYPVTGCPLWVPTALAAARPTDTTEPTQ